MFVDVPIHLVVSGAGIIVGFAFGAIAWWTQFCVAGSVLSAVAAADYRGLRAVFLAIATSLVLSQGLQSADLVDLDQSIFRTPTLHWAGTLFGGFAFGYGMILASGCGAGSLVRLGGGDLRSILVLLFIAIFGYMTLRGLTGIPRLELENRLGIDLLQFGIQSQGLDHIAAALTSRMEDAVRWPIVAIIVAGILIYVARDAAFRNSWKHIVSGLAIGVVISAGWYATGHIGADDFDPTPVSSLRFVAPIADTVQYVMTFTGATINFGIGAVVGVFLGSLFVALVRREFQFQFVDGDRDYVNAMLGGALMRIGGVFAFGCSIGNGLTGISTLSLGSVLAWTSILTGSFFAARRMLHFDG